MMTNDSILSPAELQKKLAAIAGKDYAAYQSLRGAYRYELFDLIIQQIPKDPYAPPHTGVYRIKLTRRDDRIFPLKIATKTQSIACADFLNRRFFAICQQVCGGVRGTGFSGLITINQPGQAIIERNSVLISDDWIELRCFVGLPARGRKIDADTAAILLLQELPKIVRESFFKDKFSDQALQKHMHTLEDAQSVRDRLPEMGLIAFVADQAILPRKSGISDEPLSRKNAVPFISPKSLRVELELPHTGKVTGVGIPKGITLIIGGGYHGKSTLLSALQSGIYDHIPGDGRELCITDAGAVKIRAYDGRPVAKTNISPFIKNLPFGKQTVAFTTDNASGSTSQAANIIEAVEAGASVLMMDEDTCATNFMIRDARMQNLVAKQDEPITAFIDKVRPLYQQKKISTILVLGGVGDYFDVADHIVQMKNYQPIDVSDQAHKLVRQFPALRQVEDASFPLEIISRVPDAGSIDPVNAYGKFAIHVREIRRIQFGKQIIDLTDVEQITELSQTKAIAFAIAYARQFMDGKRSLRETAELICKNIEQKGLDLLSDRLSGHFARFRPQELIFAINRLRGLTIE